MPNAHKESVNTMKSKKKSDFLKAGMGSMRF
jgi:hypothetical protein